MPEPGPSCKKTTAAAVVPGAGRERQSESRSESSRVQRDAAPEMAPRLPREVGGREGPDPTRYGDWEYKGRCIDF